MTLARAEIGKKDALQMIWAYLKFNSQKKDIFTISKKFERSGENSTEDSHQIDDNRFFHHVIGKTISHSLIKKDNYPRIIGKH